MLDKIVNNILAVTSFNDDDYVIYIEDKEVKYAVIDDEKLENNIENNAEKFLDELYNLIRFDIKNSVFCGTFNINNKKYEICQDLRSKLYTYILMNEDKRAIPDEKDVILLNSYYNNDKYVFNDKENDEDDIKKDRAKENKIKESNKNKPLRFVKKFLKVSGVTVLVLLSASVITYALPARTKSDIDYNLGKAFRKDLTKEDKSYSFDDIVNAIEKNNNIPQQDKEFIVEVFENEFEENKKYIDIERTIRKLELFKVEYHRSYEYNDETKQYEKTHTDDTEANTVAYYNSITNKMVCLEGMNLEKDKWLQDKKDKPFGFEQVNKSIYYHEMNHLFTFFCIDSGLSHIADKMHFWEANDYVRTNTGIYEAVTDDMRANYNTAIFMETINEIFSQEYVEKYYMNSEDDKRYYGYVDDLPYMYCLAEILPNEVLREYKFNDNDSIITEGLLNIKNNKDEAYEFLTALKSKDLYSSLIWRAETNNDLDEYFDRIENGEKIDENSERIKQIQAEEKENYKRIHDGFAYFYKAKYNREMSDDMNMLIYLYKTPVITDEEKEKVKNYLNMENYNSIVKFTPKGYFSKEYIENHPYVEVTYFDNDYNISARLITDEERYIDKSNVNEKSIDERD